MFLGYQNNKIVLTANTREELEQTPCMSFDRIEESDLEYTLYNGEYLTPEEVEVKEKEAQIASYKEQLVKVDEKSARSMRAVLAGTATEDDRTFLANLEAQAEDLRRQIKELQDTLGE